MADAVHTPIAEPDAALSPPAAPDAVRGLGRIVRGYGLYADVAPDDGWQLHAGAGDFASSASAAHGAGDVPGTLRIVRCTMRGSLKRERRRTDPLAVGDRVEFLLTTPDVDPPEGVIEAVLPRVRTLSRLARGRDDVQQVIVANPDLLVVVFAIREPEPHPRLVDRFLLVAEAQQLPVVICANKIDLVDPEQVEAEVAERFAPQIAAGYRVLPTSARSAAGMEALEELLQGQVSAFAGPSGVGKSSLLNTIAPERNERTGEVSTATGKGRHTTTWTTLVRLGADTWIADTPGIRALRVWGVNTNELDHLYPEFRPYLDTCFYDDCHHTHEPRCAVRDALEAGAIHPERYASYVALREGEW